jgi:hypothetical protein
MEQVIKRSRPLNPHDQLHVKAAECWLALGNLEEANREIESIRPQNRHHPEVEKVCSDIHAVTHYVTMRISDNDILEPYWDCEEPELAGRTATA